jgi:hypothetical protein
MSRAFSNFKMAAALFAETLVNLEYVTRGIPASPASRALRQTRSVSRVASSLQPGNCVRPMLQLQQLAQRLRSDFITPVATSFQFVAYFPKGLCDLHAVCESPPPINFWMGEPMFMKLSMYIMTPEPISTVHFPNPSHQSMSVCVSLLSLLGKDSGKCIPPFVARKRLGKDVPAATKNYLRRRLLCGPCCMKRK